MQCMKRVTHLTSNITTNPLWNVCSQDRCQKKYIKDSYWKTSHLQLWINQLSRLFSQLSGNLCIGLDSDTYNYLLSTLTFCDKETYQHLSAPNIPIFCDKEYFRAYQHKSSMISSGIKDFLLWLSLSNSMKTFIKISGPIYMSFSPSVSWTRECRIQAKKLINSLIFVLNIDQWPTVMIFFKSFVSSLRHHLTTGRSNGLRISWQFLLFSWELFVNDWW